VWALSKRKVPDPGGDRTTLASSHRVRNYVPINKESGPKAGMALVGHVDANRHALLNTRKLHVYSTCSLCQQTQTLNLLEVVQGQCTMGCAADESVVEGGFSGL
jgi:hypothetical protein